MTVNVSCVKEDIVERFSAVLRLKRVTAYFLRCVRKRRTQKPAKRTVISSRIAGCIIGVDQGCTAAAFYGGFSCIEEEESS